MTTFAHVGGGIAVAAAVQHFGFQEEITPVTILAGVVLGILPDLDSLLGVMNGRWMPGDQMLNHHQFFTHTPVFFVCGDEVQKHRPPSEW